AAAAAPGHHDRLVARDVGHDQPGLGLFENGAPGHPDDQVLGVLPLLAGAAAVFAGVGGVFALVAELHQGGEVVVRHKQDVPAAAAVAAVRPARRDELFAVEADGPVAPLAGMQPDGGGINNIGVRL